MPDELKPCPFCGSDGVPTGTGYTRCVNGYCPQSKYPYPSTAWNTRPIEDALRAENANLKARVDAAAELIDAMREFIDAKEDEFNAAIAHDDYHIGGKIHTAERLKAARERTFRACNRGAEARVKLEALK